MKLLFFQVGPVPPSKSGEESAAKTAIDESKPKSNDSAGLSQWAASAASILNAETTDVKSEPAAGDTSSAKEELKEITKVNFKNTENNAIHPG